VASKTWIVGFVLSLPQRASMFLALAGADFLMAACAFASAAFLLLRAISIEAKYEIYNLKPYKYTVSE
jgi:hypothetical protein